MLSHENAPKLEHAAGELAVVQSDEVAYRGQIVAAVITDSLEAAQRGAEPLEITYVGRPPDVVLRADHPSLNTPEQVNAGFPTDTDDGDFLEAFGRARVTLDETYETPAFHNNPLEPHATMAVWVRTAASCCTTPRRARHRPRRRSRRPSGCPRRRCA